MVGVIRAFFMVLPFYLFIAWCCWGEIRVNVVHARGENSVTKEDALIMFDAAVAPWEEILGQDIRIVKFRSMRNPFQWKHYDLNNYQSLINDWRIYFAKQRTTAHFNFAIVPPFKDPIYYLLGVAEVCRGTGYGTAEYRNSNGEDRYTHSVLVLEHEIGHLLGAKHTADISVMYANAIPYLNFNILPESINQVLSCTARFPKRFRKHSREIE